MGALIVQINMGIKIYSVLFWTLIILVIGRSRVAAELKASMACLEDCRSICMKLDGALELACDQACSLGCVQLLGKGRRAELSRI